MACGKNNSSNNNKKDVIEIIEFDDADNPKIVAVDFNESGALKKYFNDTRDDVPNGDLVKPAIELKMRKYQDELAVGPLKGLNTIICAPTGSGKTIVAVKIILDHLRKSKLNKANGKVLFLVPTVNLIDQQSEVIKRYIRNEFVVNSIKGGPTSINKVPKKLLLERTDVTVMTPQLLLNMLDVVPSENDSGEMTTKLTNFSLMIFDECHHTDKGHVYNEIMTAFFDIKFDKNRSPDRKLPQVIGLTASLGVGQANDVESALMHIIKISANLAAEKLAVIETQCEELEKYVYSPTDELVYVPSAHIDHPFSKHVITVMDLIEAQLKPLFRHFEEVNNKPTGSDKPPVERWSPEYTSWIYNLHHFAPTIQNADMKRKLITFMEHLIVYHNSLIINAHVPTKFAVKYLDEQFKIFIRKQTTILDENLIELYTRRANIYDEMAHDETVHNTTVRNPIVEKLKEILLHEYSAKSDSRTLIFVRTRELAKSLECYINSDLNLKFLNAGRLTGVNASSDEGGQTEQQQQSMLKKFRKGERKVVVATTVAEEGLDIEKCNIVIKYNHVTNEIALVQRRGRGRAVGSKSILLTQEEWIEKKELTNKMREELMNKAINCIRSKGDQWFVEKVRGAIKLSFEDRLFEKLQHEQFRKQFGNKVYDLRCKKCDKLITDSAKVRCVQKSHNVSIDPNIWNCLCAEPANPPTLYENISIAGLVSCCDCRNDCGIVIKYRKVYLPALKIDGFTICSRENNEKKHVRRWKQALSQYFIVDPLARDELLPMFHALKNELELDGALEAAAKNAGLSTTDSVEE